MTSVGARRNGGAAGAVRVFHTIPVVSSISPSSSGYMFQMLLPRKSVNGTTGTSSFHPYSMPLSSAS
ncbi:hypothetical protein SRABI121_00979 [Microbacterium sp. Bi121]|nr:hypothetical protein SRABI121_00979 [Microbacterium sp. Bi121]